MDQILAEETVDGGTADLVQWTLTDHLNTVRDNAKYDPATDATTVVNHIVYDAFGNVTSETNPAVDSLFLFTARPFDADTGLQNNLNRWYDPLVGRWLSEETIGFTARDGGLCRRAFSNPVSRVNPAPRACSKATVSLTQRLLGHTRCCVAVTRTVTGVKVSAEKMK